LQFLTFKELLSEYNLNNEDKNIILYNLSLAYFQKGELSNAYNTLKSLVLNYERRDKCAKQKTIGESLSSIRGNQICRRSERIVGRIRNSL